MERFSSKEFGESIAKRWFSDMQDPTKRITAFNGDIFHEAVSEMASCLLFMSCPEWDEKSPMNRENLRDIAAKAAELKWKELWAARKV